ncbi:transporter associated domain-containing protein, partial [Treponema sp. UBA753]|uniref:transporter associated domain-containing protein n=1 Tax=Treponema sp. UBA753 TaxID=1947747 RepID=UPI0025D6BC1D
KGKTEFNLDGATLLLDMKDIIGIKLNSEINETLGGWITEKLNRLPVVGDSVSFEGWNFTVEAVFQRRITEIHLNKLSSREEVQ